MGRVIDSDGESKVRRIITNDEDGPGGEIFPRNDPMEIDKRETPLHSQAEAPVIGMIRISAPISVQEETVAAERVVIRARRSRRYR